MHSRRLPSLAACALVALMVVCLAGASRGERVIDCEGDDVASAIDAYEAVPVHISPSLAIAPADRDATFLDPPSPRSRLSTAEVFRPPQART